MTLFLFNNNNNNNNNNIFYYSVTHQIYIRPDNIYIYIYTVIKESDARPILTYETLSSYKNTSYMHEILIKKDNRLKSLYKKDILNKTIIMILGN